MKTYLCCNRSSIIKEKSPQYGSSSVEIMWICLQKPGQNVRLVLTKYGKFFETVCEKKINHLFLCDNTRVEVLGRKEINGILIFCWILGTIRILQYCLLNVCFILIWKIIKCLKSYNTCISRESRLNSVRVI